MSYFGNITKDWAFPAWSKPNKKVKFVNIPEEKDQGVQELSFVDRYLQQAEEGGNTLLWRGAVFEISRFWPHQTISSATTMKVMNLLNPSEGNVLTKFTKKALAATIGCGAALFFLYPFDLGFALLDEEMLAQDDWYKYILFGMGSTIEREGIRSLWDGFALSMVSLTVSHITYFGLYDTFEPHNPTASEQFLLQLFANTVCALVTFPLDTVQKQQIKTGKSPYEIAREISEDYGMSGFYRGVSLNIMKRCFDICLEMLLKGLKGN